MTNPRDRCLISDQSRSQNREPDGLELGTAKKQLQTSWTLAGAMSFDLHPILDPGHAPRSGVWYAVSPETADSQAGACVGGHPLPPAPSPAMAPPPPDQSLPGAGRLSDCGPGPRVGACASFLAGGGVGGLCGRVLLSAGATPEGAHSDLHELRIGADSLHWLALPSTGLPPRYEHAAFFAGEDLMVYGGAEEKGPRGDIWKYNKGRWSPVLPEGNVPPPRTFHSSSSAMGQTLVIFSGGSSGSTPVHDEKVYLFDASSSSWSSPHTNGQGPTPRQGHVAAIVGNKLFIHGGMAGQEIYGDLYVLDLDKSLWCQPKVSGQSPPPLAAHGCAVIEERLFLFGGLSPSGASDALFCLNTGAMSWEDVEVSGPPPPARLDLAMCSILLATPPDLPAEEPCAPSHVHPSDGGSSSHETQGKAAIAATDQGEVGEGSPSAIARPRFSGDEQSKSNPGCFQGNGGAALIGSGPQGTTLGEAAVNTVTVVSSDDLGCQDVRLHSEPAVESSLETEAVFGGEEVTASECAAGGVEKADGSEAGTEAIERLCLKDGSHQLPDKWRLIPALFISGGMDTAGHIHSDSFVLYPAT